MLLTQSKNRKENIFFLINFLHTSLTVVEEMKNYSYDFNVYQKCEFVQEHLHLKKSQQLQLSQLGVMIVASTRIVFELFQILQVCDCKGVKTCMCVSFEFQNVKLSLQNFETNFSVCCEVICFRYSPTVLFGNR